MNFDSTFIFVVGGDIELPIVDISFVSVSILDLLSLFARACLSTFEAPPKEDLTYKTYKTCSIKKEKCMKM
jgi:hypothetical protein